MPKEPKHFVMVTKDGARVPFNVIDNADPDAAASDSFVETYHPQESMNHPTPGSWAVEFRRPHPAGRRALMKAELLHIMPHVDEKWKEMKQQLFDAMTEEDIQAHYRSYEKMRRERGERRSFRDWMDISRMDQWIGGYLYPEISGEWEDAWFNPQHRKILEKMRSHLPTIEPDMKSRRRLPETLVETEGE